MLTLSASLCLRLTVAVVLLSPLACGGGDKDESESGQEAAAEGNGGEALAEGSGDEAAPALALPVVAEAARDEDLILRINTKGNVRSDAEVKLNSEVGGTVTELLVRPGAAVQKGQPLVRLDPFTFDLAVREAQAAVDEAEQRFFESFVPESLVTKVGPTPEQRRALINKSGLAAARLRLERAQWEQARAVVTSPVTGTVDAITIAAGERISSGQQIMTVVDTRNLRVEAQVLEHDMPLLRVGGEASVTIAGAPSRPLRGRIDAILPLVDSISHSGRAIVRVRAGAGATDAAVLLRPGMYADVQLEATRLHNRRLVPSRAVIERDGRPLVFVVRDGRAQWTYVQTGRSNGIDTEIVADSVSGIIAVEAGDIVVVDGHLTLTHDAPVRISAVREREGVTPNSSTTGQRSSQN